MELLLIVDKVMRSFRVKIIVIILELDRILRRIWPIVGRLRKMSKRGSYRNRSKLMMRDVGISSLKDKEKDKRR